MKKSINFGNFVKINFGLKLQIRFLLIGQSEKSGIEIESEYQLTGHPVFRWFYGKFEDTKRTFRN